MPMMLDIRGLLRRLQREERGAVAMMCLAAILILFMLVMVIFDASKATQAKIDVQMGADTAAYSAAATGARAMNMVAFANVGKRTAVGINNMYIYEYPAYVAWVAQMCDCCCLVKCPTGGCCLYDFKCCFNCTGNLASMIPLVEGWDYLGYISGNDLWKNIEELHDFQVGVSGMAKAWSAGEAQARGIRNNANMMVVWPDPMRSSGQYAELPIALSDHRDESCLAPMVPPNNHPQTTWTAIEFMVNYDVLVDNSTSSPLWASDGPKEVAEGSAYKQSSGPATGRAAAACASLAFGWAPPQSFVPDEAAPMFLDVADSSNPWLSGDDQLRMSYILYSYIHTPALGRRLKDNYEFLSGEDYTYQRADNRMVAGSGGGGGETATLPETGMFGMARSEFYFPPANQPDMNQRGAHEMWMFHPGWMGKLRPVMIPYESTNVAGQNWQIEMDQMVQEALPTGAGLASGMFNISSVPEYDGGGFSTDQQYLLRNVAPDMKGGHNDGSYYHHFLDGMAK